MKNFSSSSSPSVANKLIWAIAVLALFGLADSTYLTATHYVGETVSCSVLGGCEQVLTSKYATISGVPIAALGIVYYSMLFLAAYYIFLGSKKALSALKAIIVIGVLVTLGLLYLQIWVIHSICQFCMISALLTTIIAVLVATYSIRNKTQDEIK
jgi:uncharacterized membrane protein